MVRNRRDNFKEGIFAIHSFTEGGFRSSDALKNTFAVDSDTQPLWVALSSAGALSGDEAERMEGIIGRMASLKEPEVYCANFQLNDVEGFCSGYNVCFICSEPQKQAIVVFTREVLTQPLKCDTGNIGATGLFTRKAFLDKLGVVLRENPGTGGAVVYFDVQRFKLINRMFGTVEGDRLLSYIADSIRNVVSGDGFACHFDADRFAFYLNADREETGKRVEKLFTRIAEFEVPFEILCNAGIYLIEPSDKTPTLAVDRAVLAQHRVKGSYTERLGYYNAQLTENLMGEQEITGSMRSAFHNREFVIYYQPQYNHSTGMLVGAEALVRWMHPEKGLIPPGQFIPVFEGNGFITQLDWYVFDAVCRFQRECLDENISVVPVSINLTRYDIFTPGFLEKLEETRKKYDVPHKYIRLEITESSALGSSRFINDAVNTLHNYGYVVEMDDFGSGYSSLNILKDIDFDVIKLDMRFLQSDEAGRSGRGGTILSSIVRMVNWLQLPVIAEGVETTEQADFLQSIGCEYIQGYLYSKPLPQAGYKDILGGSHIGKTDPNMHIIDTMDVENFWSSDSLETLIFSNYVGGAAIFDYEDGKTEILRVNKKYLIELGVNLIEKELVGKDVLDYIDVEGRDTFSRMLSRAIETKEEQECETWRVIRSSSCGEERICIRSSVRVIGSSKGNYIFYAMIRNITAEKEQWGALLNTERRFKMASEQANIYYWEYTVATKEMRPCFRCMRDLGLPALLTNYPDSAIEMGVFPPEVADMYRDWHRQIAEGVPSLEAIIPLTMDRVPFHVRYTTEFDENNHPIKAYGSATLVVD